MAEITPKTSQNYHPAVAAETDDASRDIRPLIVDPVTGRLKVDIPSGGLSGTQYDDGDAAATPTGTVAMGTDGSNVYALASDTSGHLQVDVLSMPAGGSGLTDSELRATPVPVSGTITANLGATDNAVLDQIELNQDSQTTILTTIDGDTGAISAGYATEGAALGSGVLIQGDDGTDRTNVLVDTAGHLQVDVLTMPAGGSGLTDTELRATPVPVSGTITANLSATDNAVLDSIQTAVEVIDNAISGSEMQVDVVAPLPAGTNIIGALSANQSVNIAQMNGVTTTMGNGTSGTGVQRVTIASDSTGQVIARGPAAHDAAVSGNPVLNGAEARSTDQTAVASGDVTRLQATLTGKMVSLPYATPERTLSGTASATNTADTEVIAAQGAGIRIYITSIIISNSSATDTEVVIKSATTALATYPAPANGGAVHALPTPLRLTANEALNFASLASVTTMKVSAVGFASAI